MTYAEITTHPDGTRTIDLDGKTYRAEPDKGHNCVGCAFKTADRVDSLSRCSRVGCVFGGKSIIWVPQQ